MSARMIDTHRNGRQTAVRSDSIRHWRPLGCAVMRCAVLFVGSGADHTLLPAAPSVTTAAVHTAMNGQRIRRQPSSRINSKTERRQRNRKAISKVNRQVTPAWAVLI